MNEQELIQHLATRTDWSEAEIAALIQHDEAYPRLDEYLANNKLATSRAAAKKLISRAKANAKVIATLGVNPATPRELLDAVILNTDYRLDLDATNPLEWVSPLRKHRESFDPQVCLKTLSDLNRNVLDSRFRKSDLADQIEWFADHEDDKLRTALIQRLTDKSRALTPHDWSSFIELNFDTRAMSAKLIEACLRKFIHSVKRRMMGLTVEDHLMIVFYGPQGCGKSELVRLLCGGFPSRLFASTNFAEIADSRQAALFGKYILFLDEMGKADHADVETIKTVVTRSNFEYRPMGTNASMPAVQNSTFIGTSNKTLGEIIKDTTGNRRFAQIDMNPATARAASDQDLRREIFDYVNAFDFTAMWCSVDAEAECPMKAVQAELMEHQGAHLNRSSIGLFVDYVRETGKALKLTDGEPSEEPFPSSAQDGEAMIAHYTAYCRATGITFRSNLNSFRQEMRRLANDEADFPFDYGRSTGGRYAWTLNSVADDTNVTPIAPHAVFTQANARRSAL